MPVPEYAHRQVEGYLSVCLENGFVRARDFRDLPLMILEQIPHCSKHYKGLDEGKWLNVEDLADTEEAKEGTPRKFRVSGNSVAP